ncbi:hypothetical protein Vretifemale_4664 [Volvox reticuliferus]|uniref:Uncharacterized protein n=1 Tax=Volvox reticuliferus TaxID=1737510 RepID=A0A8J4C9R7_9CHLO|nr:hypothetical protein Vretifemale_4664 [Volvox reticuliferus]
MCRVVDSMSNSCSRVWCHQITCVPSLRSWMFMEMFVSGIESSTVGLMPYDDLHAGHHHTGTLRLTAWSQNRTVTGQGWPCACPRPLQLGHRCEAHRAASITLMACDDSNSFLISADWPKSSMYAKDSGLM